MASFKKRCKLAMHVACSVSVRTLPFTCCSTKRKFGDEYFRFFLFMVLVQCIVNAVFARTGT